MYYHAEITGGVFGSGTGEEFSRAEQRGSYEPIWMPLEELSKYEVYPSVLVGYLAEKGLPEHILHLLEPHDYPR